MFARRPYALAAASAVLMLLIGPPRVGADTLVGFTGTNADGFVDAPCPAQTALTGLVTYADTYVEGLAPVCSSLPLPGQASYPAGASFGTGTRYEDDCPAGAAITGLQGGIGDWLDQVGAICRQIDTSGAATGAAIELLARGGPGGGPTAASCPDPDAAVGLRITTDSVDAHIGGLYLNCAVLPGAPPAGPTATATATGQRAAAIKRCKEKFPKGSKKRKKCLKKAKKLPA
jgi:hypothetical protein